MTLTVVNKMLRYLYTIEWLHKSSILHICCIIYTIWYLSKKLIGIKLHLLIIFNLTISQVTLIYAMPCNTYRIPLYVNKAIFYTANMYINVQAYKITSKQPHYPPAKLISHSSVWPNIDSCDTKGKRVRLSTSYTHAKRMYTSR